MIEPLTQISNLLNTRYEQLSEGSGIYKLIVVLPKKILWPSQKLFKLGFQGTAIESDDSKTK